MGERGSEERERETERQRHVSEVIIWSRIFRKSFFNTFCTTESVLVSRRCVAAIIHCH